MADGKITFSVWLDAEEAQKELNSVKKKIIDLEATLQKQMTIKSGLEQEMQNAAAAAQEAKEKLQQLEQERLRMGAANLAKRGTYSVADMQEITARIEAQKASVQESEKAYQTISAAVDKQNAKIAETNAELERQKTIYGGLTQMAAAAGDEAGRAGKKGAAAARQAGSASDALASRLDKITSRIAGLAKRVLFFSLFTKAFQAFRQYVGKALKTSDEFTSAIARLKGALATAFTPIFTAILPAITALINVLSAAISMIARFVSFLFGSTVEASAAAAESLYDEANALDAVGGGAGKAAKQLAAFDEINQLSEPGGGGGGGGALDTNKIDFTNGIKGQMEELEIYLSGALLVLGAILTFTGASIPLGLGLMAVGALGLASALKEDWDTMPSNIKKALTNTLVLLGAGALVIGAVLAFSGVALPLGLGLMAAGAASLGTAAALNWDTLKEQIVGAWNSIRSWFVKNVGPIFTKEWWAQKFNSIKEGFQNVWNKFSVWVSNAWSKISDWFKKNIAPIFTREWWAKVFTSIHEGFQNVWSKFSAWVSNAWSKISEWFKKTIAPIFTRDWWRQRFDPIHIGFQTAWSTVSSAVSSAWDRISSWFRSTISPIFTADWWAKRWASIRDGFNNVKDQISSALSGAWSSITGWFQSSVAPIFTIDYWIEKFRAILTGFQNVWDQLTSWLTNAWDSLKRWWDGLSLKAPAVQGTSINVGGYSQASGSFRAPGLATGAVIPPNREFLAVLGDQTSGTNIEAPLQTIVDAVREALGGDGFGAVTIPIYLDGQKIAENTVRRINQTARGSGTFSVI